MGWIEKIINFVVTYFDSFITGGITIIGFIVTYCLTRKNFRDEVIKNKLAITNDIIKDLPYKICGMMNKTEGKSRKIKLSPEEFNDILSNILAYGSKDAISIAIHMQQLAYSMASNPGVEDKERTYEQLATYALLITQIKYDLTSEIISPESWFYLKVTDYKTMQPQIIAAINKIVKELDLNKEFIVK